MGSSALIGYPSGLRHRLFTALLRDHLEARRGSSKYGVLARERLVAADDAIAINRVKFDQACTPASFLGSN